MNEREKQSLMGNGSLVMEYSLAAPVEAVWAAWIDDLDEWWLPELRVTSPPSVMRIEPQAGGRWTERARNGEEYCWYRVLQISPGKRLILQEHTTPNAGPLSVLLTVDFDGKGKKESSLTLSMNLTGVVYAELETQIRDAWGRVIRNGLAPFLAKSK